MTKSKIAALRKKGWKVDKESEEVLSQLNKDDAIAHVASAMQNLTQTNQDFIRSVIEGLDRNTDAIVTLVSKNESPTITPAAAPPEHQEQAIVHLDEEEKKQWQFMVKRDSDGFISTVEVKGSEKQWEFVIQRNMEGFITTVDVHEV